MPLAVAAATAVTVTTAAAVIAAAAACQRAIFQTPFLWSSHSSLLL